MISLKQTRGFTLVEVILFLAISSAMIGIAMLAVNGRSAEVQYGDSARSVEAYFNRRIAQVGDGSITSETEDCRWSGVSYQSGASDGSCIFLGYLFRANPSMPSELETLQIYGSRVTSNDPCFSNNPQDPLYCANPKPTPVSGTPVPVENYQIPWGASVTTVTNQGNDIGYFGFLRDPSGQNVVGVAFQLGDENQIDNRAAYRNSSSTTFIGEEFTLDMCLSHQGKPAQIILGGEEGESTVKVLLDQAAANCP